MFDKHFNRGSDGVKKRNRNKPLKPRIAVTCKTTGQIFANTTEASTYFNVLTSKIRESCKYKRGIWIDDTKMYFEFVEE